MTHYDATFWVGANAVLRKRALDDIARGRATTAASRSAATSPTAPSSRTPSRASTSASTAGGCYNYPERLSYSATPPDFGSLCIQRQRWANGGLLILPKLWRQIARPAPARRAPARSARLFLRINYMASIAGQLRSACCCSPTRSTTGCSARSSCSPRCPYFLAMSSTCKRCGYKRLDVFRIYGFNLILLPVNLAGAGASMLQAIIGGRPPFKRTPKVRSRTTPRLHVRRHALRVRRLLGVVAVARRAPRPLGQRRAARASTPRSPATRSSPTSACGTRSSTSGTTSSSWLYKPQRRAARQARRTPSGGADHASPTPPPRTGRRRSPTPGGRRATGGAPPLLPIGRHPGDRRSPLGDRRAGRRAPDGHDRHDTIAAQMPAPRAGTCDEQRPDRPHDAARRARAPAVAGPGAARHARRGRGGGGARSSRSATWRQTRIAQADAAARSATWFAPYVDATLTPTVAFQDRASNPARDVVLGFVVAGKTADATCTPTWGDVRDARRRRREAGPRPAGGPGPRPGRRRDHLLRRSGEHGARGGLRPTRTRSASAYRSVVDRYTADTIDFDIEGAALGDTAANARRAKAIKALQDEVRAGHGRSRSG